MARSDPRTRPRRTRARLARPTALDPLREQSYRRYFIGNVVSNLGTFCQAIAQSLLVYNLTGSTFLVGVVNFAQFAALLVLVPWTGAAADRFDRKRLIIATQLAAGVITGVLTRAVGGRAGHRAGRHRLRRRSSGSRARSPCPPSGR